LLFLILVQSQLTNVADCVNRGYIKEGEDPLEVAAQQMMKDGINVIHTIGGDDTNTQAAVLSKYMCTYHIHSDISLC
jgi:pyrophosphate--fructose-6-phosphate 1-phosphotransferase